MDLASSVSNEMDHSLPLPLSSANQQSSVDHTAIKLCHVPSTTSTDISMEHQLASLRAEVHQQPTTTATLQTQ